MSENFYNRLISYAIFLINKEFNSLRLKKISRDDVNLFFTDDAAGIQIAVNVRDSKKKILNQRFIKISMEIQEKFSMPGFRVIC